MTKTAYGTARIFTIAFNALYQIVTKGPFPKGMTEKRGEILRIHQKTKAASYYRNGSLESKYGGW